MCVLVLALISERDISNILVRGQYTALCLVERRGSSLEGLACVAVEYDVSDLRDLSFVRSIII